MTKRKKLTIALSAVTLSLVGVGAAAGWTNGFRSLDPLSEEILSATAVENIRFLKVEEKELEDGVVEKTISYTLVPANAKADEFSCRLSWNEEEDANKESATWSQGKEIDDYMTYALDAEKQQLTFRCLQPFGHEIAFEMSATSNPDVRATLTMDYRRKLIAPASITANNVLSEGESLSYAVQNETYTVGTIGEGSRDLKATAKVTWKEMGRTLSSTIGSPSVLGAYGDSYRYQGQKYDKGSDLIAAVSAALTTYVNSLIGSEKTFHEEDLKELLKYEYLAYHTFEDVYLDSTKLFAQFLDNYNSGKDESGFYLSIDAEGKASYEKRIDFDVETVKLTGIEFGNDHIEF